VETGFNGERLMKFCPRCGYFVNREKASCPKCGYNSVKHSPSRISSSKTGIVVSLIAIVIVAILFTTFPSTNNFDDSQLVDSDTEFEIPLDTKVPVKSNNQLIQFALKQVNDDREKHGVPPVNLGNNPSAQKHADDMLEVDYFSHWNSDGVKPYVTYTLFGGRGNVAENIAYTFSKCPASNCIPSVFDPFKEIEKHHYAMMYDDALSNWGHRDTIIDPYHTDVNFGIAYDNDNFYFAQHFETNIIEWTKIELANTELEMVGKLPDGFSLAQIEIYSDENPKTLTGKTLSKESPYNQNYYDRGKLVGMFLEPPPSNTYYEECQVGKIIINDEFGNTNCVDYGIFDNSSGHSNEIDISVDVYEWLESDGVHTLYVVLNNANNDRVDATSITLEYLE